MSGKGVGGWSFHRPMLTAHFRFGPIAANAVPARSREAASAALIAVRNSRRRIGFSCCARYFPNGCGFRKFITELGGVKAIVPASRRNQGARLFGLQAVLANLFV